jgi:hypothetical protein
MKQSSFSDLVYEQAYEDNGAQGTIFRREGCAIAVETVTETDIEEIPQAWKRPASHPGLRIDPSTYYGKPEKRHTNNAKNK